MTPSDPQPADPQKRSLLKTAVVALNGALAAALGVPVAGFLLGPLFREHETQWAEAGKAADFAEGVPQARRLRYPARDGYRALERTQNVWIVREGSELTVFSSECTHVGCNVIWKPEESKFKCPCHGGVFDRSGAVLAGPPPAPLHRLPSKVENATVYVQV